jgi:hypothetical protein
MGPSVYISALMPLLDITNSAGFIISFLVPANCIRSTDRKVAGSVSDDVIFFLNLPNPSGRSRPLGLLRL